MSRKSKIRREKEEAALEELLAPDAFEKQGSAWSQWAEKNLRYVVGGLVAALLLVAGVEIVRTSGQGASAAKTKALSDAVDGYREAISIQTIFTSTSAAADEKRYRDARAKFDAILKAGSEPAIIALARLYDADLARRLGDAEAAIAGFDAYLASAPADDALRFFALEGKGYAHESAGRLDDALAAFQLIEPLERFSDFGLQHVARVLDKKGDRPGAKAAYAKIVARDPASPLKAWAEQRMALLE